MPDARRRSGLARLDRTLFVCCALLLLLTVVYPTVRMLAGAARVWKWEAVLHGVGREATLNTLFISLASVACAGLFGTGLALFVTRYRFPGRNLLAALAYLPFTLPPLVGVLSFYYLIGRDGLLLRLWRELFHQQDAALPGVWAILLVHTYSFYVFFYATVAPALESMDRSLMEAARTLGAGPLRTFFQVTLPQLRPALTGAALLTFMSSGASFSAPYFFGEDFPMLSVAIYEARSNYDNATALTLTVMLALVSVLALVLFRSRQTRAGSASKGTRASLRRTSSRIVAGVTAWTLVLLLLAPHLNILWLSLVDYRAWNAELVPTAFTLGNFAAVFSEARNLSPLWNSLWMSALATLAVLVVGLPVGYLAARRRRGGRVLNYMAMIPWALPGTVIAINLIVAFNDPWLPVYNTIWMLPLAYFVRNVPLLTRVAAAAIEPFDATLLEAGQTLGASKARCFWTISLPLLAPAIAAGLALVFATSLGEFVASILLYLPSNLPISIKINMEWRSSVGVAFAYSVLLMVLVGATFVISRKFSSRTL